VQPRRMTGPVLRGVARATRAPLVGGGMRAVSLQLMGVTALRRARLGDVPPYVAELTRPGRLAEGEEPTA